MSIRFQAGFEAIVFESTKCTNWKPQKIKSAYGFNFFVQIYHEGEENFFLNKRIRSTLYENKRFRKTRLECHLGVYIAITVHFR